MFREIQAECYVMVDGDDTYPMEYAAGMVDKVLNHNADMVVGDRLSSTYFSCIGHYLCNCLFLIVTWY